MDRRSVDEYLVRIGAERPSGPTVDALAALQLAHLQRVPFENLDIHRHVPIVLDPEAIHDKVVRGDRGGYCYELNSAFVALLSALGFRARMVSARVAGADGELGPEFDHMTLIVNVVDADDPLLVDVGFGDSFTQPVPLVSDRVRSDRDRLVRLTFDDDEWWYEDDRGEGWRLQYTFTTSSRTLAEFAGMNEWQQTSPDSHFTQQTVCSILTPEGRVTISDDRLIVTSAGSRTERTLASNEIDRELCERFAIDVRTQR